VRGHHTAAYHPIRLAVLIGASGRQPIPPAQYDERDMAIFRRSHDEPVSAITEFWDWWPAVRSRVDPDKDLPDDLVSEIADHVRAIDRGLTWEIRQGPVLTVTAGGVGELRGTAERWLLAGPEGDGWTYRAARAADPAALEGKIDLDGDEFDLSYVRLGLHADARRARVDVTSYHPDFLFVSEDVRNAVTDLVLRLALGEDEAARWTGTVRTATEQPIDALAPTMLPMVVDQIAIREPVWLSGEGRTARDHPSRVAARFPLNRPDYPLCEEHVVAFVPYSNANPDRLPVEPSATALRRFEERLEQLRPHAVLLSHVTGDDARIFHLFADPTSGVLAELDQMAAAWSEGRARIASEPDPAWTAATPYQP
jgi:hypothetical protein